MNGRTDKMQHWRSDIQHWRNQRQYLHQFLGHKASDLCPVWFKVHYFFHVSPTYSFDSLLLSQRICHSHIFPLQSDIWNSMQNGFWKLMLSLSSSSNPRPGHWFLQNKQTNKTTTNFLVVKLGIDISIRWVKQIEWYWRT